MIPCRGRHAEREREIEGEVRGRKEGKWGGGVVLHKVQQDDKFTLILLNSSCEVMADDVLLY